MSSTGERSFNYKVNIENYRAVTAIADLVDKQFTGAKVIHQANALYQSIISGNGRRRFSNGLEDPRVVTSGFESRLPERSYTIRWNAIYQHISQEMTGWYSKGVRFVCNDRDVWVEHTFGAHWLKVSEDPSFQYIFAKIKNSFLDKNRQNDKLKGRWSKAKEIGLMTLFAASHATHARDYELEIEAD